MVVKYPPSILNRAIISFLLLLAGALIYATCRQEVLFLMPFDAEWLARIKIEVDCAECNMLTRWIIFCLPDALWYAALLNIQLALCDGGAVGKGLLCLSIALPFAFESMQWLGLMPGTFDWLDIVTYLLTLTIFILCQRKQFGLSWC